MQPPGHDGGPTGEYGVQEWSDDPDRGMSVRSLTGQFRGVGGTYEVEALQESIDNLDGWITVDSSNVHAGAYNFDKGLMFIRFLNGSVYFYPGSTPDEWMGFLQASSKGRWVWDVLRARGTDSRLYGIMPYQEVF